jgi:hypothetical protein
MAGGRAIGIALARDLLQMREQPRLAGGDGVAFVSHRDHPQATSCVFPGCMTILRPSTSSG